MSVDGVTAPTLDRLRRLRGQQQAVVRSLALLAVPLLAVVVLLSARTAPRPGLSGVHLVVLLGLAGFVAGVPLRNATAERPTSAAHVGSVALVLVGSFALMLAQPGGPGPETALVGVLCVARLLPTRAAVLFLVVAFCGVQGLAWLSGRSFGDLAVLAAFAAFYGMLLLAFRLARANAEAERLLVELEASAAERAQAVGLAERQRLAREMHDVLAHSLTGMVLQLEAARMLVAEDPSDPRLAASIGRAHQLGRSGLEEARRAIATLRDDDLPGPERLADLTTRFEHDRSVPCRLTVSGQARPLASEARLAVYRVAQEALTNIARHARPSRVEVHLAYDGDRTRLTVEDFADAVAPGPVGTGYGLTGMRERAELLGGSLTTEVTARGFRVDLAVPA